MTTLVQAADGIAKDFFIKPVTKVFGLTYASKKRIVINQGGSRSSKTYSIMQIAVVLCVQEPGIIFTVVGQDIPNLKKGAMRDLESILNENRHLRQYIKSINNTDRIYTFYNDSKLEFNSYANEQDAKSGGRDYSFFNEANGIPYAVYRQVAMRTKKKIFIDYNPNAEFWADTEIFEPVVKDERGEPILDEKGRIQKKTPDDVVKFITNYRHNPYVSQGFIDDIEQYKTKDPEYYKIYGLGEQGVIEGLVYKNVHIIEDIPLHVAVHKSVRAIDFGFSSDPTAMVNIWAHVVLEGEPREDDEKVGDKHLYIDEEIYGPKIDIDTLADLINEITDNDPMWSDINPVLVHELRLRGINIFPVNKNDKDILVGIKMVQNFTKIKVTRRSANTIKEFKNYKYGQDKNGQNEIMPLDAHNHSMDAIRYAVMSEPRIGEMIVAVIDGRANDEYEDYDD